MAGEKLQKTFTTKKLAEGSRTDLLMAAREGVLYEESSGLPVPMRRHQVARTWYEHAVEFMQEKWSHVSPRHRRGIAESLTTVTLALVSTAARGPCEAAVRQALYRWAFNASAGRQAVPDEYFEAIRWIETHSFRTPADSRI